MILMRKVISRLAVVPVALVVLTMARPALAGKAGGHFGFGRRGGAGSGLGAMPTPVSPYCCLREANCFPPHIVTHATKRRVTCSPSFRVIGMFFAHADKSPLPRSAGFSTQGLDMLTSSEMIKG